VATLLQAPVVLVVDASAMSQSVAALVHGYATLDPRLRLAGVILNCVGSDGHETMLRETLEPLGIPVVGALRRDDAFAWRDRHLGLVPVAERPAAVNASVERLAVAVAERCDLDAVLRLARAAPAVRVAAPARPRRTGSARIAVAAGPAFTFSYRDNLEALEAAGAELVPFDPLTDPSLPKRVDGILVGGGFPEVYGPGLAANEPLLADVRQRVGAGLVTWAECGGLLWLSRSLDGMAMCGVVDAQARMSERLTLGYRHAEVTITNPVAPRGTALRGHEFHYSRVDPPGAALALRSRFGTGPEGHATATLLATYLHVHLGGDPAPAERFVAVAAGRRGCPT
jgi:cobyrinic acid a,c-diamide synthase